jgi:hypothetical protein
METKVNKDSSDELFDLFKGIVILGKKNDESLFYIPSKENIFGGFNIEKVMISTGCDSLLLPLKEGDIKILMKKFSYKRYKWKIETSENHLILTITNLDDFHGEYIEINLGKDIIDSQCFVKSLKFHLCSEDQRLLYICLQQENQKRSYDHNFMIESNSKPYCFVCYNNVMHCPGHYKYEKYEKELSYYNLDETKLLQFKKNVPRMNYGIIGQEVLNDKICIQQGNLFVAFDNFRYSQDCNHDIFHDINRLTLIINSL